MNEAQKKEIQDIVQEIATDESISFDEAFAIAVGMLKLHGGGMPKGRKAAGSGTGQAS